MPPTVSGDAADGEATGVKAAYRSGVKAAYRSAADRAPTKSQDPGMAEGFGI